ncbi:MAG TPA: succinylglutamate desuccinylase/aspartoacylase family protein [Porticoccaceae bacterium]
MPTRAHLKTPAVLLLALVLLALLPQADANEFPHAPSQAPSFLGFELPSFLGQRRSQEQQLVVHGSITVLGEVIAPGTYTRLAWKHMDTFEGIASPTPVLVLNGSSPGPTLCLTGAVHGDEINGIEIIRQVFFGLKPEELAGAVIGVPIVNQQGFRLASRYLPDRRDLNRYFPGDPTGSSASRLAWSFFNDIIRHCDALVDIHTGSFHRTNAPQLRADLRNEKVSQLVHGFGGMIALHGVGASGSLRRSAVDAGIPAVTLEVGEPLRIQADAVKFGVERILTLLTNMGIYKRSYYWTPEKPVYFNSRWVRSDQGGLLISRVQIGEKVMPGDLLGKVVDPFSNVEYPVHSPFEGQVIGMAINQVVMPGYAVYHIGLETTEESIEMTPPEERANDGTPIEEGAALPPRGTEGLAPQRRPDLPEFD